MMPARICTGQGRAPRACTANACKLDGVGAFMMLGLVPGSFPFDSHPDIARAVVSSLVVGNVILLVLNSPLVPIWVQIMRVPPAILMTVVLGPLIEQTLRQSLEMSNGSFAMFAARPLALSFIVVAAAILVLSTWQVMAPVRGADLEV